MAVRQITRQVSRQISSKSINQIQEVATNVAGLSNCELKHGAVITRGIHTIVASGCNDNTRTAFMGKVDCCLHAEMSAAMNFINCIVRRNPKKFCF